MFRTNGPICGLPRGWRAWACAFACALPCVIPLGEILSLFALLVAFACGATTRLSASEVIATTTKILRIIPPKVIKLI
jgi:hypothetical protein